ncbi:MAG TPA: zf-HC2 domain-containing protein [Pyrinomonadaceae bacterium]|nr:zf-HC2 domain-containing protein [Pyrinomonadaceae bacterium]
MRCEDCLPLIEEYFDGEVEGQTGEQLGAHLATCADCSAALDALSFEQEVYARYDRGGLEVTPDLWARVSAEIARTPRPHEGPAAGRPFLSRARDSFAAALGALTLRPALASSLALLVVAAAAGTLWLARRSEPAAPSRELARQDAPAPAAEPNPATSSAGGEEDNPRRENPLNPIEAVVAAPAAYEPRAAEVAANTEQARRDGGSVISVDALLAESSAPKANPGIVQFRTDEHAPVDETAALLVSAEAPRREAPASDAHLLNPEQKDVERHVERAQMLLRSIKNVRASEAGGADIAYEKDLSRKLLAENATLQLEAEVKGDKETRQVLDRIEPFLLEIANMGEKPSREEVRSIGERVRQNEIVAALEVY